MGYGSDDIRGVFPAAMALSKSMEAERLKRDRLAQLRRSARERCGACSKWLTGDCPSRVHSNATGRNTDPGCDDRACDVFMGTTIHDDAVAALKAETPTKEGA